MYKIFKPSKVNNIEQPIIPLMCEMNKISRSNQNNIFIYDRNLSQVHASIEICENNAEELIECLVRDCGSLNKLRINGS